MGREGIVVKVFKPEEVNLHTHSCFCNHAVGSVEDYLKAADDNHLKVLGFTEHCPVPGDSLFWNMKMKDLAGYVNSVKAAKETSQKIKIFLGAECDYEPILENFYRDEFLGKLGFDYLIGSIHMYFDLEEREECSVSRSKNFTMYLSDYVGRYCRALESDLFLFGCHPDLFRASYHPWDENAKAASKDIIQCAIDLNIPLEINGAGLRKPLIETSDGQRHMYSTDEFFIMAKEMGAKLCSSSDAHKPALVRGIINDDGKNECEQMAERLGITFIDWSIDDNGKISCNPQ